MTPQRPGTAISIIQTEILLAYYFFDCNRVVEGQVHANGAVSLALACGLHKIEPGRHAADSLLPPPADPTEEQERVNAWWHVFMLEKLWTTALETPSVITEDRGPDSVVDTPWPRDQVSGPAITLSPQRLIVYQHGYHSPYGRTVKNFLANVNSDRSCALLALLAKSAALYEKAAYIACLRSRSGYGHFAEPPRCSLLSSQIHLMFLPWSLPWIRRSNTSSGPFLGSTTSDRPLSQLGTILSPYTP